MENQNPNEKFYPDGMFFMPSHPNSPEWAKGKVIIYEGFIEWFQNAIKDPELVTIYKGKKQIQFEVNQKKNEPNKGYAKVSTYQKEPQNDGYQKQAQAVESDDDIFAQ